MGRGMAGGNRLGTGIISGAKFEDVPKRTLQILAASMIVAQIAFTFVTAQNSTTLSGVNLLINLVLSVAWVALTSAVQWGSRRQFGVYWWMYFIALGLSVIPTVYGFWLAAGDWATRVAGDSTTAFVVALIVFATFDIIQEMVLLD